MSEKILHSYSGIFDTPDEIIHAAEKTVEAGYTKFDVNTPYPIHGMPKAMNLEPSKLGYAALVFGLSGTLTALFVMYWMAAIDYPITVGGKPFFAFPKYIPIMFEVTVLAAAIGTVSTMLFFFFKFPNNAHPLHDTSYMKKVSSDKYGLIIQADDPKFNEEEVKAFFASLHAKDVEPVYYDMEDINASPKIYDKKFIGGLALTFILVSGITYFTLNKLMFMVPFNWMMYQDKLTVQEKSSVFPDEFGVRTPVAGTVARGFMPYEFPNEPELAGEVLLNPLVPTEKNLALGKKKYDTYCSPCHGDFGDGDSRLRGQFPNPPSLHSEKVRNWSDGRIFHVITMGQNIMPSYSSQLTREEKWATVLYVRALERSKNAKESDLK
jgi:hypothetical protein